MIEKWFEKDLEHIHSKHAIAVFVDESGDARFLLKSLNDSVTIYETNGELDELKTKYEIEKKRNVESRYLIYTNTPKDKLKFVREYCETNGCIEIKYFESYIKQKVNHYLNLNINLPKEELISAAKVSIGKDQTYWMDLSHKGASEIFDMEKELLPFLDNPETYLNKYDKKTQLIFFKKIHELLGITYVKKPAETLAKEVVNAMLKGLANNKPDKVLLNVYKNWLDSVSYKPSFFNYLAKYKLQPKSDIFNVHPSHPFRKLDELWLSEIGSRIDDRNFISSVLPGINQRVADKIAVGLGITFWVHVKTLLEFDEKNINQISNFNEAVDFYLHHYHKVDHAIRKLYSEFLTDKKLIEPLQAYYKNLSVLFLDKWFRFIDDFEPNQKGKIQELIDKNAEKTAIVVGDGVSWEFSRDIISRIGKDFKLTSGYLLADLPSETEHNMSRLYVSTGEIMAVKKDREKFLSETNPGKSIGFVDLENVTELTSQYHYLICSYKDPDKLGETYQQKALKYFDQVADLYAGKIQQLLQNGYKQVYLITDHGYTLTGMLEESDKIEVRFNGVVRVNERYILTKQPQLIDKDLLLEKKMEYKGFRYCYFAKRLGPFKTPGVYGYSHGGLSPQETIVPFLKWTSESLNEDLLQVIISNKAELQEVAGNLFAVKLKGVSASDNLFTTERKIILLFFADGVKVNESDIITIEKNQELKKEYQFGSNHELEMKILDAITREQLDGLTIKQGTARDMGGLL